MQSDNDRGRRKEFWIRHIEEVCQEVKSWAEEKNWQTHEDKKLMSDNLGNYEAPTLSVKTSAGSIKVDPICTTAPISPELIHIRSLSTSKKVLLVRDTNDGWVLRDGPESDWQQPWGREAFFNIVNDLTSK